MDEAVELARAFGGRIADRFDLPVYLYAQAAARARARQARRRPAGPVRGPEGRDRPARPRARLRARRGCIPRPARSRSGRGRSSSPTTSISSRRRGARRSGSRGGSASRAAGCRRSRRNGFFIDELGRAQVSMNLLDFQTTPLWRVWETVRAEAAEDGIELAESELIGLAPLARVPRCRRPCRDAPRTRRSRSGWRPRLPSSSCATSRRCRPSSSGWMPPAPTPPAAAPPSEPLGRRMTFRVIPGRPRRRPAPGLLVVGAAEIVTLAGGLRAGSARARSRA